MTGEQMWRAFTAARGLPENTPYEAWAFGGDPDRLAKLTLEGVKTATSSAYPLYALEKEPLPEPGEYSVILNSRDEAVCVILTEAVEVVPYREVEADHARREGEGDLSLSYWRAVHERFFQTEMAAASLVFDEDMPVVCERFRRVWPEKGECHA